MSDTALFWIFALTIGIPIAVVVVARAATARHHRRLRRYGRTVQAHVSSLGTDPGDEMSSATYWAKVQYDDDGDFVTTRVSINRAEYDRFREGTRVLVTYLPGMPTSARRLEELVR